MVYSLQTLSVLPQGYKKHFNTIEKLGPKYFSGSILLWDGDGDYSLNINNNRGAFVYNLYNMEEFKNSLKNIGFDIILIEKWVINKVIDKDPSIKGMGTYTLSQNGENLQVSGPLLMPWYFWQRKNIHEKKVF